MIDILRDPGWGGIAGLIAIATLLFYFIDRRSSSSEQWKDFFLRTISSVAFALYGLFAAPLIMGILGSIASLTNFMFGNDIYISGRVGDRLLSLSEFGIWMWAFASTTSILERQLGAAGLFIGGFANVLYFGYLRIVHGDTMNKLPNWYHFLAFASIMLIMFIGFINIISGTI